MVKLGEKEICPKKDLCMFAKTGDEVCIGCIERNSPFVCELDFMIDDYQVTLLSCQV